MKEYFFVIAMIVLSGVIVAGLAAWILFGKGQVKDLEDWERYGYNNPQNGSSTASTTISKKAFGNRELGFSFEYPSNFTLSDKKDGSAQVFAVESDQFKVETTPFCISNPDAISGEAWEGNFTQPGFESAVGFDIKDKPIQSYDLGNYKIFAYRQPGTGSQGFSAVVCTGGLNDVGNQAGRCIRFVTNRVDQKSDAFQALQDFFLKEFLPSVRLTGDFENAASCPGLSG